MKKSLIEIWKAKNQILEGIKNNIFRNEDIEIIAENRQKICDECPSIDKTGDNCVMPGTQPCCSECGCSLKLKTRSLSSSCPLNKWEAILNSDEADMLDDHLKK